MKLEPAKGKVMKLEPAKGKVMKLEPAKGKVMKLKPAKGKVRKLKPAKGKVRKLKPAWVSSPEFSLSLSLLQEALHNHKNSTSLLQLKEIVLDNYSKNLYLCQELFLKFSPFPWIPDF